MEQLERATGNFSAENFLGEGGCGEVFKGALLGHTLVAVKKLNLNSLSSVGQLQAEIDVLSKYGFSFHNHLARLLPLINLAMIRLFSIMFAFLISLILRFLSFPDSGTLTWSLFWAILIFPNLNLALCTS